jgi:hypothetical protein
MTLLVAAVEGERIWMVSDTAISGVGSVVADREYQLKIVPSLDGGALLGFSGDAYLGVRIIQQGARLPAARATVAFLLDSHHQNPSVDLAYAYMDDAGPHLVRISQGEARELLTFHIGDTDAFEHFQRIRLDAQIHPVPEAVSIFFSGSRDIDPVPEGVNLAITSMLRLIAERSERDVGGWPTAYYINGGEAFFCGYLYATSDPILSRISPGSIVPPGTAEAGGFSISVTGIGQADGVAVYWLQQPGGIVFRRTDAGYEVFKFKGTPMAFKEQAFATLGQQVEVIANDRDQPDKPIESLVVMRDENGRPSMVIGRHGDAVSFSILNVGSVFRSRASVSLRGREEDKVGGAMATDRVTLALSEDKGTATLDLLTNGTPATGIELQAHELGAIVAAMGEARALMRDAVPVTTPEQRSARELVILDPVWRTDPPLHPALSGISLRLRHPGFGWLSFVLPYHEAQKLGRWLQDNAHPPRNGR